MYKYLITVNPGHNRIYFKESCRLSVSELELAFGVLETKCTAAKLERLAGVAYISFEAERELSKRDLEAISRLSFCFAVYKTDKEMALLQPVMLPEYQYLDSSVSEILRYTGKTNELFTRLLINTALMASVFYGEERVRLLDPLMGKGTALFEGLVLGMDVSGIEIAEDAVAQSVQYIKKYLERAKLKHTYKAERISGEGKSFKVQKHELAIARTKDEMRVSPRLFTAVGGDTVYADRYYKKSCFHIITADLPYGVQHGSIYGGKASKKTRSPEALLVQALPAWHRVLKKGGALALSWNTFVLGRSRLAELLEEAGFHIPDGEAYRSFAHRVDNSISRDIIVAVKK